METNWIITLISVIKSEDISIVACIIAIVYFMKYDSQTDKSTGHKYIALCLGIGFLLLILFRIGVGIYTGFYAKV